MLRGFKQRCPACGEAPLYRAYLKPHDTCPACGEDLHHLVDVHPTPLDRVGELVEHVDVVHTRLDASPDLLRDLSARMPEPRAP